MILTQIQIFCSDTVRENIDLSMIGNHIYLDLIIVKNLKKMDYFYFYNFHIYLYLPVILFRSNVHRNFTGK